MQLGISCNACDHQSFRVLPKMSSHFMKLVCFNARNAEKHQIHSFTCILNQFSEF